MEDQQAKPKHDMDERVSIPLDPEDALKALLAVEPEPQDEPLKDQGDALSK
jgi:hypothetical protein